MEDPAKDLKKIIKKERRRFSKRKRIIREEVREEALILVDRKVKEFVKYLERWCDGYTEEREEGTPQT